MHKQFNESMRYVLAELLSLNLPKAEIAKRLGVHRTSVYRELCRNSCDRGYLPQVAQGRATT